MSTEKHIEIKAEVEDIFGKNCLKDVLKAIGTEYNEGQSEMSINEGL